MDIIAVWESGFNTPHFILCLNHGDPIFPTQLFRSPGYTVTQFGYEQDGSQCYDKEKDEMTWTFVHHSEKRFLCTEALS